jgi:hypothetical protein
MPYRSSAAIKAYQRQYRIKNRKKLSEAHRQWRFKNPEKMAAATKRYLAANKVKTIAYYRRRNGLPEPLYSDPGLCEICGRKPNVRCKNLCLDHCHTTGKFRGWLCSRCNLVLGNLQDSPEILRKAADYIEKFNHQRTNT